MVATYENKPNNLTIFKQNLQRQINSELLEPNKVTTNQKKKKKKAEVFKFCFYHLLTRCCFDKLLFQFLFAQNICLTDLNYISLWVWEQHREEKNIENKICWQSREYTHKYFPKQKNWREINSFFSFFFGKRKKYNCQRRKKENWFKLRTTKQFTQKHIHLDCGYCVFRCCFLFAIHWVTAIVLSLFTFIRYNH